MRSENIAQSDTTPAVESVPRSGVAGNYVNGSTLAALAAVLGATAYVNALQNPFVYDDIREIVDSPALVHLAQIVNVLRSGWVRPLVTLSYSVDFTFWGLNPVGFHLTNIVLHVVNVLLVFRLVRSLVGSAQISPERDAPWNTPVVSAFAAASLFAVHPLMTEAVGYVSSRSEVLAATLVLTSFACFQRAMARSSVAPIVAGIATFLLALAARESAVMLPFLVLAYDWWLAPPAGMNRRQRIWRIYVPLAAIVLPAFAVRLWIFLSVEYSRYAGVHWDEPFRQLYAMARYLALLLVPYSLSVAHDIPPVTSVTDVRLVAALATAGTVVTLAIAFRKREPLVPFAIAWFFLFLVPSSALSVLLPRAQPFAEHRAYLASVGFFLIAGVMLARLGTRLARAAPVFKAVNVVAFASLVALLLALTIARNYVWSDNVRLWTDAARKAPHHWTAQWGLAHAQHDADDHKAAIETYRRVVAISPDPDGYLGLVNCLLELRRFDEARAALRKVAAAVPTDVRPLRVLADLEERVFRNPKEALRLCRQALTLPEADLAYNVGQVQLESSRKSSVADIEACVRRNERTLGGQ